MRMSLDDCLNRPWGERCDDTPRAASKLKRARGAIRIPSQRPEIDDLVALLHLVASAARHDGARPRVGAWGYRHRIGTPRGTPGWCPLFGAVCN